MTESLLKTWHLNVRATQDVQSWFLKLANDHKVDIVALQDISPATGARPGKPPISSPGYQLAFEFFDTHRVCFYVRKELDSSSWKATCHDDLYSTLTIQTECDVIHYHNIYNCHKRIPIKDIIKLMEVEGQHVLLGDFNLHHTWWGGKRVETWEIEPQAMELFEALEAEMILLTPQEARTWEKALGSSTWATLDLMLVTPGLGSRTKYRLLNSLFWPRKNDKEKRSDHIPGELILEVGPNRTLFKSRRWNKMNKAEAQRTVGEELQKLAQPEVSSEESADDWLTAFYGVLRRGLEEHAPIVESPQRSIPAMSINTKHAYKEVRKCERDWKRFRTPELRQRLDALEQLASELHKIERENAWSDFMADSLEDSRGVSRLYKWTKKQEHAKESAHMSPLEEGEAPNKTIHTNPEDQCDCLARILLLVTPEATAESTQLDLPFPIDEQSLLFCAPLDPGELDELIKQMPKIRATVENGIPNLFLKVLREVIVPYLERFFNACLKLCYFPVQFREAKTIVLRKKEGPFSKPKNWRPIALLCSIGKILEKIMTQRLTKIAVDLNLIPPTQMAFTGRTTTSGLLLIETIIRAAWSSGLVASVLSLDMSGAFNRVNRQKLLQLLYDMGVPTGLIAMIRSFLTNRTTTINIPGYTSRSYFVFRGVAQGSPLSPILFLLFTAPLLRKLTIPRPIGPTCRHAFAFADDTYIIEVSDTFMTNCVNLAADFQECLAWARSSEMEFGAHKLDVTNFTKSSTTFDQFQALLKPSIDGFNKDPNPKGGMKVLGVMLDPRLSWDDHIRYIMDKKVAPLKRIAKRILGPENGLTLDKGRQLYTSTVLSAIAHALPVWYSPDGPGQLLGRHRDALAKTQSHFLRLISGAHHPTRIAYLEKELCIYNIEVELTRRSVAMLTKLSRKDVWQTIENARMDVLRCGHHSPRPSRTLQPDPYPHRMRVAFEILNLSGEKFLERLGEVAQNGNLDTFKWDNEKARSKTIDNICNDRAWNTMSTAWEAIRAEMSQRKHAPVAALGPWGMENVRIHDTLTRLESIGLIRMRTEVIRFRDFLFKIKLAPNPYCLCGHAKQTVYHLLVECPLLATSRAALRRETRHDDFKTWLTQDAPVVAKWAVQNFRAIEPDWLLHYLRCLDRDPQAITHSFDHMTI